MATQTVIRRGAAVRPRVTPAPGRAVATVVINVLLLALVAATLAPYLFRWASSIKSNNSEIFSAPIVWWPSDPTLKNFSSLFSLFPNAWRWYVNTAVIAVIRTALGVLLASMAGFAFAKYEFRFKNALFILMLATSLIPFWVVLVPLYLEMAFFHWFNTYLAVIIPGAVGAFAIFWMRQYSSAVPSELMEAARIDGASEWAIFWRVALPILMPGVAVIAILGFTGAWNDFLWPLIVLTDSKLWLINVGIASLVGPYDYQYGILLSAATLGSIPVIIVFILFQRQLITGMTSGAFKGI
jgi:multiple sugar transport system permease protein/arabinosaccharide transport system permease protein